MHSECTTVANRSWAVFFVRCRPLSPFVLVSHGDAIIIEQHEKFEKRTPPLSFESFDSSEHEDEVILNSVLKNLLEYNGKINLHPSLPLHFSFLLESTLSVTRYLEISRDSLETLAILKKTWNPRKTRVISGWNLSKSKVFLPR